MTRRDHTLLGISLLGLAGIAVLIAALGSFLWRESVAAEERLVGGLATTLGGRAEAMILDTRALLREFEALPDPRCSASHLQALREAAMSRPHIRAIGYWRAATRQCGVGFLQASGLRPPRADRIYESGVIAWWPSPATEVGGIQLFLMRFGDHDIAMDPHALLDIGPLGGRQAGLWVESLRLTAQPADADLPLPGALPIGLTLDRQGRRAISRFSRTGELAIEIVAVEPLGSFWGRYQRTVALGSAVGLLLLGAWVYGLLRYTRHRMSRAAQLRSAISRGRIEARYQPIIDLSTNRCVGAEVLARWTTDGGEVVPPEAFVHLAEREGLATDLTLAVLSRPLREMRALLQESPDLTLNLNVSPDDLHADRFIEGLMHALDRSGVPARAFKLEITERALVRSDSARQRISTLRRRGHEVAVDDFGTGYSSLSYLSSFELDVLKIDKIFVDAIGTGAATRNVIVHVIEMARSLGLRTVAEGVESEMQRDWLREHGVEYGQGFLFSPPLTADDFTAFVRLWNAA